MNLSGSIAFVLFLSVHLIFASQPIPVTYDGHRLGNLSAQVTVEAFFDFLCPDSKAAWPIVQQVLSHYGPEKVQLILHVFPLPYHRNAFLAAQAGEVVSGVIGVEMFWKWTNLIFANQNSFFNSPTANLSSNQVIDKMGSLVSSNLPISKSDFIQGMQSDDLNELARVSWKFAASKGIYGTPMFWVNGILTSADESWTYQNWLDLLDPLFQNFKSVGKNQKKISL
eukprot:TRINITY_DN2553_c0_g1_i1.p1 TRINITY_DN2553_c0_g1~~TRINITY_DN2553_c0_g1_i1.p1  ORF type:complete len:225 (+),score=50.15 TRINITY_DN2553_c0_g1_i1:108-782(+)